jgi:hypothetical protein
MFLGLIGPIQIILFFILILFGVIFLAFYLGKKVGYNKRVKETEKSSKSY